MTLPSATVGSAPPMVSKNRCRPVRSSRPSALSGDNWKRSRKSARLLTPSFASAHWKSTVCRWKSGLAVGFLVRLAIGLPPEISVRVGEHLVLERLLQRHHRADLCRRLREGHRAVDVDQVVVAVGAALPG